jgi:CRISPR-associated protein Cas1
MATLYVTEPGARIEREYQQVLVTRDDEVLARVPLNRISHVVLVGNVGATTPALHALLDQGVSLALVRAGGELRGRLAPASGLNWPLRRAQYQSETDAALCLAFARAVVRGKLRNSQTMMQRLLRRRDDLPAQLLPRIDHALAQVESATTLDALRGVEGSAARAYFGLLKEALRPEMGFEKRQRRPPPDPANALLSLGYTLLTEALMTALEVVGLDPYVGFFHAGKYGRPALALDLAEEFRAPIVDSLVLTLVNKRMIGPEDFEAAEKRESGAAQSAAASRDAGAGPSPPVSRPPHPAVYLNRNGRRVFFREFADRLETETTHALAGRRLTYRKIFELQARLVARVVTGQARAYRPFYWR